MSSIYDLKARFQKLLMPVAHSFRRAGLTPNVVTLIGIGGSIIIGVLLFFASARSAMLFLLSIWLFARMALNAIDGLIAREFNLATTLGAMLNEAGDVISDLALYLPLAFVHKPAAWPIVAFCIGAIGTEFCGLLCQSVGASRRYDGPMGKSDRAFFVGALALLTGILPLVLRHWFWLFIIATVLTFITCVNRILKALAEMKKKS